MELIVVFHDQGDINNEFVEEYYESDRRPLEIASDLPALEFRWHEINSKKVLQVKNLKKPTHSSFSGYNMDTFHTVYGYTDDPDNYDLNDSFWPDAAVDSSFQSNEIIEWNGLRFTYLDDGLDYKQLAVYIEDSSGELNPAPESGNTAWNPMPLFIYRANEAIEDMANDSSSLWPLITKRATTTIDQIASAGDDSISVNNSSQAQIDFSVGSNIVIDKSKSNEETATVIGHGSILLKEPLKFTHQPNAIIQKVDDVQYTHTTNITPSGPAGIVSPYTNVKI